MIKKAIVVGANGFIGKATVQELLNNDYKVIGIINTNVNNLIEDPNITYYKDSDMLSNIICKEVRNCDYIFNYSWKGIKGKDMGDYDIQISNIYNSLRWVKIASVLGAKYIHAGSIIELESLNNLFVEWEKDTGITHIYGVSKLAAHMYVKFEAQKLNIKYNCGLITNAYGPGENNSRLITTVIKKSLKQEQISLSKGDQYYDFVYITDVAKAFRLIAEKGIDRKTYTIGSGNPKPLKTFMETVNEICSPNKKYDFGNANVCVDNLPKELFSTMELEKDTDFKPSVQFITGIKKTYSYWNNQLE